MSLQKTIRESDLYPNLKSFLEAQGYEVKSEVLSCDVVAIRGEEAPLIIELKLSLNLSVILQAVDRLAISDTVYVGVPAGTSALKQRRKKILKLFRMLGLGLITIDPDIKAGSVDILLDPGTYRPRINKRKQRRLLGEFTHRVGDPNEGGTSTRKGVVTAYRQRAIQIAQHLKEHGNCKASDVASALQEPKARDILYRNVYGWFENVSRGVYCLSPRGLKEISDWLVIAP